MAPLVLVLWAPEFFICPSSGQGPFPLDAESPTEEAKRSAANQCRGGSDFRQVPPSQEAVDLQLLHLVDYKTCLESFLMLIFS